MVGTEEDGMQHGIAPLFVNPQIRFNEFNSKLLAVAMINNLAVLFSGSPRVLPLRGLLDVTDKKYTHAGDSGKPTFLSPNSIEGTF